jgi:hypothetical protein
MNTVLDIHFQFITILFRIPIKNKALLIEIRPIHGQKTMIVSLAGSSFYMNLFKDQYGEFAKTLKKEVIFAY